MNKRKWENGQVVSLMTHCDICGALTTKRNYKQGLYYCEECNNLSDEEIRELFRPDEYAHLGCTEFEQLMRIIYGVDIKDMTAEEIDEEMERIYLSFDSDDKE